MESSKSEERTADNGKEESDFKFSEVMTKISSLLENSLRACELINDDTSDTDTPETAMFRPIASFSTSINQNLDDSRITTLIGSLYTEL